MNVIYYPVRFVWQGISGLWNMCTSTIGIAAPATVAVLKTDTNKFYVVTCLFLMFALIIIGWVCMFGTTAYTFYRVVAAVAPGNTSAARRLAFFAMIILAIMFHPLIIICSRLVYILPGAILLIYGHTEAALPFFDAVAGVNQPQIAYWPQ